MKKFFKLIASFAERLNPKPVIGGLQITDAYLQYASLKKGVPELAVVRLSHGTIKNGIINNVAEFKNSLRQLRESISNKKDVEKIVVALPASVVFTQTIKVPYVRDDQLEESALLNLRIASPISDDSAYISWQKIGEVNNQYEILGAFAEKKPIDAFRKALISEGFYPITFELPGTALARLFQYSRNEVEEDTSDLITVVGSDGIHMLVLRNGLLYFNQFTSWELMKKDEKGDVSKEEFEVELLDSIRKVISFSSNRLGKSLGVIFFIAPGIEERVHKLIRENFDIKVMQFNPRGYNEVSSHWFVALGSAMSGEVDNSDVRCIGFGDETPSEIFFRKRVGVFIGLWRNIVATVAIIFLIAHGAMATFLVIEVKEFEKEYSYNSFPEDGLAQLSVIDSAQEFNSLIVEISRVYGKGLDWIRVFDVVFSIARSNGVVIKEVEVRKNGSVELSGYAIRDNAVIDFKDDINNSEEFRDAHLPLSRILSSTAGVFDFTMTFKLEFVE